MSILRKLATIILSASLCVLIAVAVRTAVWGGPFLLYSARQPSIPSECGAIQNGISLPELERSIHSRGIPMEESITENALSFGRWETCRVELDPVSRKVIRAEIVDTQVH